MNAKHRRAGWQSPPLDVLLGSRQDAPTRDGDAPGIEAELRGDGLDRLRLVDLRVLRKDRGVRTHRVRLGKLHPHGGRGDCGRVEPSAEEYAYPTGAGSRPRPADSGFDFRAEVLDASTADRGVRGCPVTLGAPAVEVQTHEPAACQTTDSGEPCFSTLRRAVGEPARDREPIRIRAPRQERQQIRRLGRERQLRAVVVEE